MRRALTAYALGHFAHFMFALRHGVYHLAARAAATLAFVAPLALLAGGQLAIKGPIGLPCWNGLGRGAAETKAPLLCVFSG